METKDTRDMDRNELESEVKKLRHDMEGWRGFALWSALCQAGTMRAVKEGELPDPSGRLRSISEKTLKGLLLGGKFDDVSSHPDPSTMVAVDRLRGNLQRDTCFQIDTTLDDPRSKDVLGWFFVSRHQDEADDSPRWLSVERVVDIVRGSENFSFLCLLSDHKIVTGSSPLVIRCRNDEVFRFYSTKKAAKEVAKELTNELVKVSPDESV